MGLRFHRVFSVLPGVRINLSKTGVSTSIGPRCADLNIGRNGVTTNAGIPGTGLSYRSKLGSHGSKLGVLALIVGVAFAGFRSFGHLGGWFAQRGTASTAEVADKATPAAGRLYVHRGGSVLRESPKSSARVFRKEAKGHAVQLLSRSGDWAQVRDGDVTGWMRASVLAATPPR